MQRSILLLTLAVSTALLGCSKTSTERLQLPALETVPEVDLGPNYEYAVVGHPSRDYLWILSRTPRSTPRPMPAS